MVDHPYLSDLRLFVQIQRARYRACPAGTYNSQAGAGDKTYCIKCPAGHYCKYESKFPRECPQGKYLPSMGATSILACKICPAGNYCPKSGLVNPVPCPDGFVCPPGTKSLGQANVPCPIGHFCRGGSKKRRCPAGSYQVRLTRRVGFGFRN